jgi:glucose-1-phosphate adenylyltransferase
MLKSMPYTIAFVLAGGQGTRLLPLTAERCKPSVPFNGNNHIVDFVLSNLANSGLSNVYLLAQYRAQGLIDHVEKRCSTPSGTACGITAVTVLQPQLRNGLQRFNGTADAVAQNLHLLETHKPDLVAVFSADHICRMDVGQMIQQHVAADAEITVATLPVPVSQCASFGIVETDHQLRIRGFREKPATVACMPGRPGLAMASMGNYIFSADVLRQELACADSAVESDFGKHLLPRLLASRRMLAYDFADNLVPGLAEFEHAGYWRDVGTIDAYFDAHFDTVGARPKFRMANPEWPIYARTDAAGPSSIQDTLMRDSVVGANCVVTGAHLQHAMLRHDVRVENLAQLDHAIVMDRSVVGRGARIVRAIIDQDNYIPAGEVIGIDLERDRQRFHVSGTGVVVVPRGYFPEASA